MVWWLVGSRGGVGVGLCGVWRIVCWLARLCAGVATVFSGGVEVICDDLTLIFAFGGVVV